MRLPQSFRRRDFLVADLKQIFPGKEEHLWVSVYSLKIDAFASQADIELTLDIRLDVCYPCRLLFNEVANLLEYLENCVGCAEIKAIVGVPELNLKLVPIVLKDKNAGIKALAAIKQQLVEGIEKFDLALCEKI